jgi:hypothetical protein
MAKYIVTSDRFANCKRGDILDGDDLDAAGVNVDVLIDSGHISTYAPKKPAKTKDTETDKD